MPTAMLKASFMAHCRLIQATGAHVRACVERLEAINVQRATAMLGEVKASNGRNFGEYALL